MNATLMRLMILTLAAPMMVAAQVSPRRPDRPAQASADAKMRRAQRVPDFPDLTFASMDLEPLMDKLSDLRFDDLDMKLQDLQLRAEDMQLLASQKVANLDLTKLMDLAVNVDLAVTPMDVVFGDKRDRLLDSRPAKSWAKEDPADLL